MRSDENNPSLVEASIGQLVKPELIRITTAGSVDDGKSTLLGRLLYDQGAVYQDHLKSLGGGDTPDKAGDKARSIDFSRLTDGLKSEREQGITIDVAYRFFSSKNRRYILADCPGHEQYTRNMATGASLADVAIILIDARNGVVEQTKRHAFVTSLLGVAHQIVAINKMDLVEYQQAPFEKTKEEFLSFSRKLNVSSIEFIPMAAIFGENVCSKSTSMPWYTGPSLMEHLDRSFINTRDNLLDFRLPVQKVFRSEQDTRVYLGEIASGSIRRGEEVVILPSMRRTKVKNLLNLDVEVQQAYSPMSVAVTLEGEQDVSRGNMICRPNNIPRASESICAMLVWMSEEPLRRNASYLIKHTTQSHAAALQSLHYRINVNDLRRESCETLRLNEIGLTTFDLSKPIFADSYQKNRSTGSFILVNRDTNATVAAGMITDRLTSDQAAHVSPSPGERTRPYPSLVSLADRSKRFHQNASTIWFTGVSGAGKSSVAAALEKHLFSLGHNAFFIDADTVRSGLNSDLSFSRADRTENVRRIAEMAKMLNQAGMIVVVAVISPKIRQRDCARDIIGKERFCEVFVNTPLEVCVRRDSKGIYKQGEDVGGQNIKHCGYEVPKNPTLEINTQEADPNTLAQTVYEQIESKFIRNQ